jgi:hypothetical protein
MKNRKLPYIVLLVIAAACTLAPSPMRADTAYGFQTLNNPTDPTFNQLLGINNGGTIAGYFGSGSVAHPNKGYTLVPPATYTNENFPNSVQTQVIGINSNASPTTVGFWIDGAGNNFGFVDQSNSFTSVSDPNVPAAGPVLTQLLGVNKNGIAAGFYLDVAGNAQGFLYNIASNTFTAITLPAAFNAVMTTVTGVSDSGVVTGFYVDNAGNTHGFIDNGGIFASFDDPNANGNTMFFGLNNLGMIVGSYADINGLTNGLVYNMITNTWQTVDDPNASATPAFNVTGTTINGINDKDQLVGFYSDGTNVDGMLATPVPEPASLYLIALGAASIVVGRRKFLRS